MTLEKAMKMVRQQEAVHQHNSQLQSNPETKDSGDLSFWKYKSANNPQQGKQFQRKETKFKQKQLLDVLDVGKALTQGKTMPCKYCHLSQV